MRERSMLGWLWLAAAVIALDQLSKTVVARHLQPFESVALLPFFHLTYLRNQGAAFSLLSQAGGWQRWLFIGLGAAASVLICYWLSRMRAGQRLEAAAWSLILGGALGNLIDRVRLGYVVDFLDVFYDEWHWPAFNVADSAITIGVGLLLWDSYRAGRRR